jgi:predicted DNA-binding transcriptional regulator AlpA
MTRLPETGFLRLSQIVGNQNAIPPIVPIIPISKSSWWQGVSSGRYPAPLKLSPKVTVWRVEDIREMIARLGDVDG